ncbi:MAG: transcription antitermination factor NusB [Proteobacteria bacterium]|nr:transcription antitermination factor NusB [Pseudomonadota bacterium]
MSANPKPISKRARIKARRNTVQALYEWFMTGKDVGDVIAEFENDKHQLAKTDVDYFKLLLRGTIRHHDELDTRIVNLLDRPVDELDAIERAILHIGCYELEHHLDIPWRVVVNESIELAKMFGAEESYKYINGVLDKVARELRSTEINSAN